MYIELVVVVVVVVVVVDSVMEEEEPIGEKVDRTYIVEPVEVEVEQLVADSTVAVVVAVGGIVDYDLEAIDVEYDKLEVEQFVEVGSIAEVLEHTVGNAVHLVSFGVSPVEQVGIVLVVYYFEHAF